MRGSISKRQLPSGGGLGVGSNTKPAETGSESVPSYLIQTREITEGKTRGGPSVTRDGGH